MYKYRQAQSIFCLGISVLLAFLVPFVAPSLNYGEVSGDELEHFNVHPLTKEIALDPDPVQAVHIALYGNSRVRITWLNPVQFNPTNFTFKPTCRYGQTASNLGYTTRGYAYSYQAGMFRLTLNSAIMDLSVFENVHSTVYYSCGDPGFGWSIIYRFTYQPTTIVNPDFPSYWNDFEINSFEASSFSKENGQNELKTGNGYGNVVEMSQLQETLDHSSQQSVPGPAKLIVLIADMGVTHALDTMRGIQKYVESGMVQLLVHAGDVSYADNFGKKDLNNSYIWVEYMNEMKYINPWIPYMTCPGNHEAQFDFAAYLNWVPMPHQYSQSKSQFWYSFDYMGVHFLSFSTEHPFDPKSEQFSFIQLDLIRANQNRASVPWLIVMGHRPLYCTSVVAWERCEKEAPVYRSYLEDLFHEQKVDVYLCGHNHNYERTYPVYQGNATQKDFKNPKAPVYIVDGAAGNPEPNDPSFKPNVDWRAYVYASVDNGFLLAEPTPTQLRFRYVRSHDQQIIDSFTISRTS